jgi:predicted metal-dependent phosphoesterase TrpH
VDLCVESCGPGASLSANAKYAVRFFSKVDREDDTSLDLAADSRGALRVTAAFQARGEYALEVRPLGSDEVMVNECLFAADPALAVLLPLKGDVHLHTTASDGRNTPVEMLARACELDMDFVAVTDHDNFVASRQARQAAEEQGLGLTVLTGEEVTIRGIGGHVLGLNHAHAVGARRHRPDTDSACAAVAARLAGRPLCGTLTPESYSHAVWTVERIREGGGLALMAHPFWVGTKGKFYPPRCVYEQLLRDGLLDGIELLGGSPSTEGNLLAVAHYGDELLRGRRLPIVGGSDAHSVAEVGSKFTIALADQRSPEAVLRAIAERRCVACDTAMGSAPVVLGPFDLVEYVYFLLRVYFPLRARENVGERFWYRGENG